jgi:hypothetical protein
MIEMTSGSDVVGAVTRFAADVAMGHGRMAVRIQARLEGEGGMAHLCAVEALISELWPPGTAKELIWLTRVTSGEFDVLHLRAFGPNEAVVCEATFQLVGDVETEDRSPNSS